MKETMSELGERIATLEAENKHMKEALNDLTQRLAKVEKTIWWACGALGALQVILAYAKH